MHGQQNIKNIRPTILRAAGCSRTKSWADMSYELT